MGHEGLEPSTVSARANLNPHFVVYPRYGLHIAQLADNKAVAFLPLDLTLNIPIVERRFHIDFGLGTDVATWLATIGTVFLDTILYPLLEPSGQTFTGEFYSTSDFWAFHVSPGARLKLGKVALNVSYHYF